MVGTSSNPNNKTGGYKGERYTEKRKTRFGVVQDQPSLTLPVTEEAKRLKGAYAGFQPKPALEPILVVMKPLNQKTYLDQALQNGKGCTWLDDCRIPVSDSTYEEKCASVVGLDSNCNGSCYGEWSGVRDNSFSSNGRFPANVLVENDMLNDGVPRKSHGGGTASFGGTFGNGKGVSDTTSMQRFANDSGSASRYFDLDAWWEARVGALPEEVQKVFPNLLVPKASKREKNAGLEINNAHPTVKPVKLMSYLVMLGSREDDIVLDPYMGSGTTGIAAIGLKRNFLGCELDPEYVEIARARIKWIRENGLEALRSPSKTKPKKPPKSKPTGLWKKRNK